MWGSKSILRVLKNLDLKGIKILNQFESGSETKFFKVRVKNTNLMIRIIKDENYFKRYLKLNCLLRSINIRVPKIYYSSNGMVIEEDVEGERLEEYILKTKDFSVYKKVVKLLLTMQLLGKKFPLPFFTYSHFQWEVWYFKRYFVELYCGMNGGKIEEELEWVAYFLGMGEKYFMHRDFQSKNLLIEEGELVLVDYQDAHRGVITYDLASLLKDAYVEWEKEEQEKILHYYYTLASPYLKLSPSTFKKLFLYSSLQRCMQMLGAFAYLGGVKGKLEFNKYIKRGVRELYEILQQINSFPLLFSLVKKILHSQKLIGNEKKNRK